MLEVMMITAISAPLSVLRLQRSACFLDVCQWLDLSQEARRPEPGGLKLKAESLIADSLSHRATMRL